MQLLVDPLFLDTFHSFHWQFFCVYYAQETPCFHYILFMLEVAFLPIFRCQSANKVGVKKILFVLIAALEKTDFLSAVQERLLNSTHHFLISSIVNFPDVIRISS